MLGWRGGSNIWLESCATMYTCNCLPCGAVMVYGTTRWWNVYTATTGSMIGGGGGLASGSMTGASLGVYDWG